MASLGHNELKSCLHNSDILLMPSWTWIILWFMLLPQNNHRCKYFSSHRWNSACLWSIFIMINGNLLFSSHTVGINKPSFIWKLFFSNRSSRISDIHVSLQWPHNDHDGVSNHQPHGCLFSHLFRRRSKKTSNLRVTGLCAGNSPVTGEFPAQRASNAENVSIWWRHHVFIGDAIWPQIFWSALM